MDKLNAQVIIGSFLCYAELANVSAPLETQEGYFLLSFELIRCEWG